jgi:hypothetical protein
LAPRVRQQMESRLREPAVLHLEKDSNLGGSVLVALTVRDGRHGDPVDDP